MLPLLMLLPAVNAAGVVVENGIIAQFPAYPGTANNAPGLNITFPTKDTYYDVSYHDVPTRAHTTNSWTANTTMTTLWWPSQPWPAVWTVSTEFAASYNSSFRQVNNYPNVTSALEGLAIALLRSDAASNTSTVVPGYLGLFPAQLNCTQAPTFNMITPVAPSGCYVDFSQIYTEAISGWRTTNGSSAIDQFTPGDGYYAAIINHTIPVNQSTIVAVSEQFSIKNTTTLDPSVVKVAESAKSSPASSVKSAALGLAIPSMMVAACTLLSALL